MDNPFGTVFAQQFHRVPVCIAVVDNDGKPSAVGECELLGKPFPLDLAGRVVFKVIIQADLTDCDDLGRVQKGFHFVQCLVRGVVYTFRVDSHPCIDIGICCRQRHGVAAALQIRAHVDNPAYTLRGEIPKNLPAVLVKCLVVVMCV